MGSTDEMETRKLGPNGFDATVLALGCWTFGGAQWGDQNDADSLQAMRAALDLGINHFDTAQGYGKGRSERLCGEVLPSVRERVYIATKISAREKEQMAQAVDVSLARLKTDYIDLFYIHWPRSNVDMRPIMEALEEARANGKIRGVGVSNFSIEQMKHVMEVGRIDAHQLCYNLFWRFPERDVIPFCRQQGIAVVTYSSIAQGVLTGKFGPKPQFREGDQRPKTVLFEDAVWPHVHEGVEKLKPLAEQASRPLEHLAIRWVAAQEGITSVLVGVRNAEQVRSNSEAMAGTIGTPVLDAMTSISDEVMKHIPDAGNIFRHYP